MVVRIDLRYPITGTRETIGVAVFVNGQLSSLSLANQSSCADHDVGCAVVELVGHLGLIQSQPGPPIGRPSGVGLQGGTLGLALDGSAEQTGVTGHIEQALAEADPPWVALGRPLGQDGHPAVDGLGDLGVGPGSGRPGRSGCWG